MVIVFNTKKVVISFLDCNCRKKRKVTNFGGILLPGNTVTKKLKNLPDDDDDEIKLNTMPMIPYHLLSGQFSLPANLSRETR